MDLFECIIKTNSNTFYSIKNKEIKKYNLNYVSKFSNNLYLCSKITNNVEKIVFLNTTCDKVSVSDTCNLYGSVYRKQKFSTFPTMITNTLDDINDMSRCSHVICNDDMYCISLTNDTKYSLTTQERNLKKIIGECDERIKCIIQNTRTFYDVMYLHAYNKYYAFDCRDMTMEIYCITDYGRTVIYSEDHFHLFWGDTKLSFHIASFNNVFVGYYAKKYINHTIINIYVVNTHTNNVKKICIEEHIENIKILSVNYNMIYIYLIKTKEINIYSLLSSMDIDDIKTNELKRKAYSCGASKIDFGIKFKGTIDYICELKPRTFLLINKKLLRENKTCITFRLLETPDPLIINKKTKSKLSFLANKIINDNVIDCELIINMSKLVYNKYKYKYITEKIVMHDDIWTTVFKNFL